jgi:hypothetical protein
MFASPFYHQKPSAGKAPSAFLKYLSPPTLAFVLFIALALLSSIGGKESETKKSTLGKSTKGALVVRHENDDNASPVAEATSHKTSPWQSIGRMMNAVQDAFNDPSLIEYANQQDTGIPGSPTTTLLSNSSQQPTCSRSPSHELRSGE